MDTDQSSTRVRPVKFDAHIELSLGSAAELQPLSYRQPHLCGGQGEVINLVSCGKGREEAGVNGQPIVFLRLHTLYRLAHWPSASSSFYYTHNDSLKHGKLNLDFLKGVLKGD